MTGESGYAILCAVKRGKGFLKAKQRKGDRKMDTEKTQVDLKREKGV